MRFVSLNKMREINELAMSKYDVTVLSMLDSAARNTATFISALNPNKVVVVYGKGNKGALGLSIADYLINHGVKVAIVGATSPLSKITEIKLQELRNMGIEEYEYLGIDPGDLIVDALIGTGLQGNLKDDYSQLVTDINLTDATVVSLDVPTGLDATTGELSKPYVLANYTLTLALPKEGLLKQKDITGELFLVDIGVPVDVYDELGIEVMNPFLRQEIVRVDF